MLLHSIPREVNTNIPEFLKKVMRAYRGNFHTKGIALFLENNVVVGAGWRYEGDYEYRNRVIDGYCRWAPDHIENWLALFERDETTLPEFDPNWIEKRINI